MSYRVVDLSISVRDGMRGVQIEPELTFAQHGVNINRLVLSSHAATHLDAPLHWVDNGPTLDDMDLHKCCGPAWVLDLHHKAPDDLITVVDLQPYESKIGPGGRLLLRTDWDQHADLPDYRTDFPHLSLEVARWLADKGIALLGLDTPSVASLKEGDRDQLQAVHYALLSANVVIVECLANLRFLSSDPAWFVALPLKIARGDGSPVRAVALEGFNPLQS